MTQGSLLSQHLSQIDDRRPTFVALGSFDGVHLGHQAVIKEMISAARKAGARTASLTLFPHPKRVTHDLKGRYYLTTLDERLRLLDQLGLDLVITLPFNDETRHMRAAQFVDLLMSGLDMRQLWGGGFSLGYKREGDETFLRELGRQRGFEVVQVSGMALWNDQVVSSSRIREALANAAVAEVNGCLGRPFSVQGPVVKGDQRGRQLGFPTANVRLWEELILPADGVYATWAWVDGTRYAAATNVGLRPTVDGRQRLVEAYLLDFEGDIYGREMRLEFVEYVRPEQKFSGLDALVAQIAADVRLIRQRLSAETTSEI